MCVCGGGGGGGTGHAYTYVHISKLRFYFKSLRTFTIICSKCVGSKNHSCFLDM